MASDLTPVRVVLEAASFAAEMHAGHKRKGAAAEPYINHPLEVARMVAGAISQPDTNLIAAALLHDVVEDAQVTREELERRFGADVAALVMELTDDKSLPKTERKRLQVEHAPHLSVRAQLIKLADKISNLRDILNSPPLDWSHERQREYFAWAKEVVHGFTAPNPVLKPEFDATLRAFENVSGGAV
jgi:guanosine-3',5'-bis(diphosphate) 3'-pyrophosphohydrolase